MKAKLITLLIIASMFLISYATAADVCCQKLADSDDRCVYTDEENCDPDSKNAAVGCGQTNFCKIGCCYSSDEGQCYKNVPKSKCESITGATWTESASCDIPQCQKGCCIMGSQGFFVTEVRCKLETSEYGDVTMEWKPDIISEPECQALAKSQDMGCCVTGDTCTFTTRELCTSASTTPTSISEEGQEGFYKDMLCSNDQLSCGCAKQTKTGCYDDKVYWFDSCGNRENVYSSDKTKSYNKGYVIRPDDICSSPAILDPDCGNCDYGQGSICRAASSDLIIVEPTEGEFICSKTSCDSTYDDGISPSAGDAKKNGESWCLYDSQIGQARDLVGSRHYRRLCINGEEMVEPCMDYREEICLQGVLGEGTTTTYEAFSATGDYVEAACRDNRWEDCADCNDAEEGCGSECSTAAALVNCDDCTGDQEDEVKKQANALAVKLCCAQKCCEKEELRDCYFLQPEQRKGKQQQLIVQAKEGQITSISNIGYCVPEVPPGLQFWPSETTEPPTSTTRSSPATTAAVTTGGGVHGQSSGPSSNAESVCSQADQECTVVWSIGGTGKLGIGGIGTQTDYECVSNCHCMQKDWVIGGNTLCKAQGDCGAYFNILGRATMDGYTNTASEETTGSKGLYFNGYDLTKSDLGDWKTLMSPGGEALSLEGGGDVNFFSVDGIKHYTSKFGVPLAIFAIGGVASLHAGGTFMGGVTGGLDAISSWFGKGTWSQAVGGAYGQIAEKATVNYGGTSYQWTGSNWYQPSKGDIVPHNSELHQNLREQAMKEGQMEGGTGMGAVQTAMWLYTAYKLIDIFMADTKERTYAITCSPWVAPTGGSDCEKCNEDTEKPCSIYRCKSLGQSCYLVNQGTSEEKCVDLNSNDVNSPIIDPWEDVIPSEYSIKPTTSEGNKGYKINEKIGPYDSITLGIKTDEPAQCKFIDKSGTDFDEMTTFFGDSQYIYEHQTTFVIPAELTTKDALRATGDTYNMYIRCKDAMGNKNERDYFIRFTLKPEPDMMAPNIEITSIDNNAYIASEVTQTELSIYTDERAECSYDIADKEYGLMANSFKCSTSPFTVSSTLYGLYECKTTLDLNVTKYEWYIRCKDTSSNKNSESYKFRLSPTEPLEITSVGPEGTFYESEVTLTARTAEGAEAGKATCAYGTEDEPFSNMVLFLNTDSTTHDQLLTPGTGEFTYYIKCLDAAGNMAEDSTTFTLDVDLTGPKIIYIYVTPSNYLHLEMDEASTCEYGNETFTYGEGKGMTGSGTTIHELSITEKSYNIICQDEYYNEASFMVYP